MSKPKMDATARRRMANKVRQESPSELFLTADAKFSTPDGEPPRIKIEAYNGGRMQLNGFRYKVVVDLDSATFRGDKLPIVRDHDMARPIGHAEEQVITASGIDITGLVSVPGDDSKQVVNAHKSGFKWQASIGAHNFRAEFIGEGRSVSVNGKRFTGPIIVARGAVIHEVSILAMGADKTTSVNIAASKHSEESSMSKFDQWLEAKGWDKESLSDDQVATLQASFDADSKTTDPPATDDLSKQIQAQLAEGRKGAAEEIARVNDITRLCAAADLPQLKVDDKEVDLGSHAIEAGWSAQDVELHILRNNRPAPQQPAIHSKGSVADLGGEVLTAALCKNSLHMSDDRLEASFDSTVLEKANDKRLRTLSIHQLMDEVIHASGSFFSGNRKSDAFIEAAFEASNKLQAAATTTLSLPNIFENALNKLLLSQYMATQTVWQIICARRPLNDFRPHGLYRLDGAGGFQEVAADGELTHMSLQDSKSSVQAVTQGLIMAITRRDLINDDMGALSQRVQIVGRRASMKVEETVIDTLLGGIGSYFTAGNNNSLTGAGSALGLDGLNAAQAAFRNMVDADGQTIGVPPKLLIVPSTLESTGKNLYNSAEVRPGSSTKMPVANNFQGLYRPYTCSLLNNTAHIKQDKSAIQNQSDTHWFLMADPSDLAALYIGFLGGRETPVIENAQMDFHTLGIQMRAYFDFGVAFGPDTQAAVYNAGA